MARRAIVPLSLSLWVSALGFQVAPPRSHWHASKGLKERSANGDPNNPVPAPKETPDMSWPLAGVAFSLLPLAAFFRRKTLQTTVVPGQVWTMDQVQGVVNVNVPVRATIIKLKRGGLWVHNPVAPTPEHLGLVRALEAAHGPVKHIVLGTVGLEHKALAGPFSAAFPGAEVWLQPGQWSFPLPLPSAVFGFPASARTLPTAASPKAPLPPWADEIPFEVLGPLRFKAVGAFGETAFVHKASGTLVVTDAVVKLDPSPPSILDEDPRPLLFHSRDGARDADVADTPAARRRGWRRIALFGLVFFPSAISVVPPAQALREAAAVGPAARALGDGAVPGGLYPWEWVRDDTPSFEALRRSGGNSAGLFVAPILRKLILNRDPEAVRAWVGRVTTKLPAFRRVIPCHMANAVKCTPRDFKTAFAFLDDTDGVDGGGGRSGVVGSLATLWPAAVTVSGQVAPAALEDDLALLSEASALLERIGIVAKAQVKG